MECFKFKLLEHWRNQNPSPDAREKLFALLEQAREAEGLINIKCYRFLTQYPGHEKEGLQRLQEQLKRCLSRKYKNFLSSDWLPVEDAQYFAVRDFYVPIMLEEKIQTPGGAQRGQPVSSVINTIHEVMQDKTGNHSILMEGEGGIGKSSTMAYLAMNWASGDDNILTQFDLLFYIKLSEVTGKDKTLEEIINEQHEMSGIEDELKRQLHDKHCQVLLILDGLDEYLTGTNTVIDEIINNGTNVFMCKTCVIITSRSEVQNLHLVAKQMNKVILARGFDRERVIECTRNFFRSAGNEKEASKFLKNDILELLRVPIILVMAYLLHQEQIEKSVPSSKTEVLGEIIDLIIDRKKSRKLTEEEKNSLKMQIGQKAWTAAQNGTIVLQKNELNEDILTSGLVHEIDAKVTVRGRQKRVTFPHKLFMDYLAAWYICNQNIQESLKEAFPKWDDIKKNYEVVKSCCRLMMGQEEVITHIGTVFKEEIVQAAFCVDCHLLSLLQDECRWQNLQNPYFVTYPQYAFAKHSQHVGSLSEMLSIAKLVVITDLTGEVGDDELPCNADIVLELFDYTCKENNRVLRTLQRHRDHIIAIRVFEGRPDVMEQISSLLPSSSLQNLFLFHCNLSEGVVKSLAEMPQLSNLVIWEGLASHAELLLAAVKAWNGQSKVTTLKLVYASLPDSLCHSLLVAIAANCPHLKELKMGHIALTGCLDGFLQNPPPALRKLGLWWTHLLVEDIESLSAAITQGKLQHLQHLNLSDNHLGEDAMTPFLESMTTAITAGKLKHLEELHLQKNVLTEAQLTPLLHALLNTLGDRELEMWLGDWYVKEDGIVTIAPSKQKSAGYYLEEISTALCSGTASTSPTNDSDSYTSCSSKPPPRKLKKRKCNIQ